MKSINSTVYFDHNVLDSIIKGRLPFNLIQQLIAPEYGYIPVFSSENLEEIERSKGYEATFLNLLKASNAKYLMPGLTSDYHYTGEASLVDVDPFDQFELQKKHRLDSPEMGYGFNGMLQKFYGGLSDKNFSDIFSSGATEFDHLLDSVLDESNNDEIQGNNEEELRRSLDYGKLILRQLLERLGQNMDEEYGAPNLVRSLEKSLGGGPKILNNICGPRVLEKLWKEVQKCLPNNSLSMEQFFGLEPVPVVTPTNWPLSTVEKVNAIYHTLNFIGYYRDKSMHKPHRFGAHFSDMTHAGLAAFTELFISMDEDLVKKAMAAYEYLSVKTVVVHMQIIPGLEPDLQK